MMVSIMGKHFNQRPAFQFPTGWNAVRQPQIEEIGSKRARKWQEKAFNLLSDRRLMSVYGPPATGKGVLICMLAADALRKNPNLKVIIAAPQKMITRDIKKQSFYLPSNGELIDWAPVYLNDSKYNKNTNLELSRAFLVAPRINGGISDGAIVMTHSTLVNVFNKYGELLKNILIFFDEQHHIMFGENDEGTVETNQLGNVVRYALNTPEANLRVCLTTATPYRGDRYPIIPETKLTQFQEYEHPYDEAWPDFAPLENFGVDFILYKGKSYKNSIQELIGDRIEPSIIFIPNVGSRFSVGDKKADVHECYKAISGKNKPVIDDSNPIFTYVKKGKNWICCINLVDEYNRDGKSKAISDDHDNTDPTKRKIDVIIALGMMKEGANWRWAKNEYIIGTRNSLREFVQMIGRLFRSAQNKTSVKTYYLIPYCDQVESDEYEDNFNDYMKATTSSLLLIKVYAPRLIMTPIEGEEENDLEGNKRQKRVSFIDIVIPDDNTQGSLLEDARDAIISASEEFDFDISINNGKINQEQRIKLRESLNEVLNGYGVTSHREEVKEEILRWFVWVSHRSMIDTTGMNVKEIDYDLIKDLHPCLWALNYSSGMIGTNTFREYRAAVEKSRAVWMEQFEHWNKYHQKQNGEVI